MAFKSKTKNRNPINQNRTIDAIHIDILNIKIYALYETNQ